MQISNIKLYILEASYEEGDAAVTFHWKRYCRIFHHNYCNVYLNPSIKFVFCLF